MRHDEGAMKVDFTFAGIPAGSILDLDGPPRTPGTYRYSAYRSVGHLRLREELARAGFARVTCGRVTFRVRAGADFGAIEVDDIKGE
jgi:hypothetical protein